MLPLKPVTILLILLNTSLIYAGEVLVECEKIEHRGGDLYTFHISVDHADEGWEHYADRFELINAEKHIFATRVLRHPHVNERPFTRSVTVMLKQEIDNFTVRGHDSVHGYGKETQCNLKELLNYHEN